MDTTLPNGSSDHNSPRPEWGGGTYHPKRQEQETSNASKYSIY